MKKQFFLTLLLLSFAFLSIAQKTKNTVPSGCQRVPVTYSETTSYNGSVKGSANIKIWNGQVNGQYSNSVKREYTVKEVICPKRSPPALSPTPLPMPRPTPTPKPVAKWKAQGRW